MKVAILDDYQGVAQKFADWSKLNQSCDIKVFREPFDDEAHAIENLKNFEAFVIMRERTPITANLINNCPNLKFITTSGPKNRGIDFEATKKKNILVSGTKVIPSPTAELTWGIILSLARNLRQETENMYQGYWQTTVGVGLKDKTLGIIGFGKLGQQIAKIANAFGMNVIAWSENLKISVATDNKALAVTKEELLEQSDFISIHYVLSERSRDLIKYEDLSKMKSTAFIVNTSRGPLINENDLIKALEEKKIAGVGLDVYDNEPLPENHKLRFLPNAFLTPHLGYVIEQNYEIFYSQMAENLQSFLDGTPQRVIDGDPSKII